nr:MAG TPA: hypothetical protein [Caudoviricetes sp.]
MELQRHTLRSNYVEIVLDGCYRVGKQVLLAASCL